MLEGMVWFIVAISGIGILISAAIHLFGFVLFRIKSGRPRFLMLMGIQVVACIIWYLVLKLLPTDAFQGGASFDLDAILTAYASVVAFLALGYLATVGAATKLLARTLSWSQTALSLVPLSVIWLSVAALMLGPVFYARFTSGGDSGASETSSRSDGWSVTSKNDPFAGNVHIASKSFSSSDADGRIDVVVECAEKKHALTVRLESYLGGMAGNVPNPFITGHVSAMPDRGMAAWDFAKGQVKLGSKEAELISHFFEPTEYNNVLSYAVPDLPDFRDITDQFSTQALLYNSPAILWLASGPGLKANLPMAIQVMTATGEQTLQITSDRNLDKVLSRCNQVKREVAAREPLMQWGFNAKVSTNAGDRQAKLQGYVTNTTDNTIALPDFAMALYDGGGKTLEESIVASDRRPVPAHSTIRFGFTVGSLPASTSQAAILRLAEDVPSSPASETAPPEERPEPQKNDNVDTTPETATAPEKPKETGPSFDCNQAASEVENMVCSSSELSRLDVILTQAYRSYMDSFGADQPVARQNAPLAQRRWLAERNRCVDEDCVKASYTTRINILRAQTDTNQALGGR